MTIHPGSPAASGEYFYTAALKGLVQQLSHLAFFGDGISLVLGPSGSGKSMLCAELEREFIAAYCVAAISLDADAELIEVVKKVSQALGVYQEPPQQQDNVITASIGEMLAGLRHYIQALAQDKKLVILIIDDAHYLDEQSIGALISLLQGRNEANCGLRLVLLSQPGLEKRIDSLQVVDVAVYDFEMPNFSPSEMADFLDIHGTSTERLSSSKLQKIWSLSYGYPGLALGYAEEGTQSSTASDADPGALMPRLRKSLPLAHMAAITVLVAVLVFSFFTHNDDGFDGMESEPASGSASILPHAISGPAVKQGSYTSAAQNSKVVVSQVDQIAGVLSEKTAAQESLGSLDGEPAASPSGEQRVNRTRSEPVVQQEKKPVEALEPSPLALAESTVAEKIPPRPQQDLNKRVLVTTKARQGPIPLNDAEVFLMSQPPNSFTLQVVAASKKASLDAYMQRQSNRESLKMYRGKREGKSWYVVVQGAYTSREMALQGIKQLPEEQAKAGPWPRKISSIQEEIETFRRN